MSDVVKSGPKGDVRVESDLAPIADVARAPRHVAEVPGPDVSRCNKDACLTARRRA